MPVPRPHSQTADALPGYTLPPVPPQGARVILLRHGRSTLNDAGRYQGSADDSQLTHGGREASRSVGQYLRHCPIDRLYVSPLQRAQQTVAELLPQLWGRSPSTTACSRPTVEDHPWYLSCQQRLLSHHPETPVQSVGQADFLRQWQGCLADCLRRASPATLTTVVVVCQQAHAEVCWRWVVGCPLCLFANALAVLHYPGAGQAPILQALNISDRLPAPLPPLTAC